MLRLLEGEVLAHKGVGWIVKGYQHPPGYVVAYPRYDLMNQRKLYRWELERDRITIWEWDCLKRKIPVIPTRESIKISPSFNPRLTFAISSLSRLLEKEEEDVELSGSSLINNGSRDVDVIVYGSNIETALLLQRLIEKEILRKVSHHTLIREYMEKHSSKMSVENYLKLKRNTILHFMLGELHINVKLVSFSKGFNYCYDRVETLIHYDGPLRVLDRLTSPVIPSRYLVEIQGEVLEMETLREIYSELNPGKYFVTGGVIEERKRGKVLVPDHGIVLSH